MNVDFKKKELLWTQQIKNEYAKYQLFINDTKIPKYQIKYIYDSNVSYFMRANLFKRPVILNVNVASMLAYDKHCHSTLFHEFTHMWDSENIFIKQPQLDRIRALSLYTEYHASQIQFLRFMEFDSVTSDKKVKNDNVFWWLDHKCTAYDYYEDHCKLLQESITKYSYEQTIERFKNVIDSYLYLFGIKHVYDSLFNVIDIPLNDCIFHKEMLNLYKRLQEYEVELMFGILLETQKLLESIHNNFSKE